LTALKAYPKSTDMTLDALWTHTPFPIKLIVFLFYGTVVMPLYGIFMFLGMMVASWFVTTERYHKYKRARDIRSDGLIYVTRGYSVLFLVTLAIVLAKF